MPTYDYVCKSCDHRFEEFQSMSAKVLRTCPKCGKKSLERLIGIGAGVLFKGGGFYETDYRSESYTKSAEAEKKASEPTKSESATKDAKPDTKSESVSTPKAEKADKAEKSAPAPKSDAAPKAKKSSAKKNG
jgi:putative FmdB family regulatory protein